MTMTFNFTKYKIHPVCELFPEMPEKDFGELTEAMLRLGQQQPIVIDGDTILDGRHRYKVCLEQDLEPIFQPFSEILAKAERPDALTPASWIVATNLNRRNLNEDQKAAIALQWYSVHKEEAAARKRAGQVNGGVARHAANGGCSRLDSDESRDDRDYTAENAKRSDAQVAAVAGVSRYKVSQSKKIKDFSDDLHHKVAKGEMTAAAAEKVVNAKKPPKPREGLKKEPAAEMPSKATVIQGPCHDAETESALQWGEATITKILKETRETWGMAMGAALLGVIGECLIKESAVWNKGASIQQKREDAAEPAA
jgi:hypothetical protein